MSKDISINSRLGMGVHAAIYGLGATLGGIAADQASAAVIIKTGTPVMMSDNANVDWDVDGDATAEFSMSDGKPNVGELAINYFTTTGALFLTNIGGTDLTPITAGDVVSLASAGAYNTGFCTPANDESGFANYFGFLDYATGANFSGVFGFQFDNGGTVNYGLAMFTFANWDGSAPVGTFTINAWAYEDDGSALTYTAGMLGDVPAPPAALLLVSGLAMGAAGLRRRRKAVRVH
ncbi:MAG: hypothetical protein ACJAVR_002706 [Paracoccaceae bacterium]|jgi:hypothetical protein